MRHKIAFLSLLLHAVVATNVTRTPTSRVVVHIPFNIHHVDGDQHVLALFGVAPHSSGSIASNVYLTDQSLCQPVQLGGNHSFPKGVAPQAPFLLLGNSDDECTPVIKARHSQAAGAAALVLKSRTCQCDDKECTDDFGPDCSSIIPRLVDDGSGSDVSIPVVLLWRPQAHKVAEVLRKGQPVLMEITWGLKPRWFSMDDQEPKEVAPEEAPVEFHLWFTSHDPTMDLQTLSDIRLIADTMGAEFQPRYALLNGSRFKCTSEVEEHGPCGNLCTNHGRYCALHAKDLSGHAIVAETLRQLCIWKHYGPDTNSNPTVSLTASGDVTSEVVPVAKSYWDYVLYHKEHCYGPHDFISEDCLNAAFTNASIDKDVIQTCMTYSGGFETDTPNTLLDEQLDKRHRSGVTTVPAVTLQHRVLSQEHAAVSAYSLFEQICEHYYRLESSTVPVPKVCLTCSICVSPLECLRAGGDCDMEQIIKHHEEHEPPTAGTTTNKKRQGWTLFWLVLLAACVGGAWYYHTHREQFMDTTVGGGRGILNGAYMQLTGES